MRKLRHSVVNTTGHKGNKKHPLYTAWNSMVSRCYYSSHSGYPQYGGRGIKVCSRWLDFNTFVKDMGNRPTATHQLDRKDSNGMYSPDNCRWTTPTENTINSRPRNGRKCKGAYRDKKRSRYFAAITWQGKSKYIGSYATELEAHLAYKKAMKEYYGVEE